MDRLAWDDITEGLASPTAPVDDALLKRFDSLEDGVRVVPYDWLQPAASATGEDARWAYARSLEIKNLAKPIRSSDELAAIVRRPEMRFIRRVLVWGGVNDDVARAASTHALAWLTLIEGTVSDAAIADIATARCAETLELLALKHLKITSASLVAIASSTRFAKLRALDLEGNAIDAEGLRALLASPIARNLVSLSIARNKLNADDVRALAESNALPSLQHFNASGLGAQSLQPMFRSLKTCWL